MTTTETLKLALEALENAEDQLAKPYSTGARYAITALREALASEAIEQPAPVAKPHEQGAKIVRWNCPCGNKYTFHGFTEAPPQRLPDKLVYDGYETPQYIEGWNDCREFMKGMK